MFKKKRKRKINNRKRQRELNNRAIKTKKKQQSASTTEVTSCRIIIFTLAMLSGTVPSGVTCSSFSR